MIFRKERRHRVGCRPVALLEPLEGRQLFSTTPTLAPTIITPGSATSPGPVLTTTTPTFSWHAVTGQSFTAYQLNLDDLTADKFVSYQIAPSATSYTVPTALTNGDQFVWNLRLDDGTASGPPSTYFYFQTQPLPAPVVIGPGSTTSPGPELTAPTPTFTWHAVTGVTFDAYQLNLYDETTKTFSSYQISKTATSFTLPAGVLAAGDAAVWNLRLKVGSETGPESAYLYFQVPPAHTLPAPVVVSPGTTTSPGPVLTTTTPTFTWKAVTGVTFTAYQLNIEDLTADKLVSYLIAPSATSYTLPTALTNGDSFVWNLRLVNGNVSGPPSTYLYFQTPPTTALVAPVVIGPGSTTAPGPVVTTTTPTFTWHAVTGVAFDTYQLNLYDETTRTFSSYQISKTATSFTLPAGVLAAGDLVVWNLRLKVGSTTGPESAYLYFQVA